MGIDLRKVPKDWQHPKDNYGRYKPMFAESYEEELDKWIENHRLWQQGGHPDQKDHAASTSDCKFYAEWHGDPPCVEYYNPNKWDEKMACYFQVYENITEGTPISPVFEHLKEVEDWVIKKYGLSRSAAKAFCSTGYRPTGIARMPASPGVKQSPPAKADRKKGKGLK